MAHVNHVYAPVMLAIASSVKADVIWCNFADRMTCEYHGCYLCLSVVRELFRMIGRIVTVWRHQYIIPNKRFSSHYE